MAQKTQVTWTPRALDLLIETAAYLADHIGQAKANKFQQELTAYIQNKLSLWPEGCPPCRHLKLRKAGYRCCAYKKKYVVVYRIEEGDVVITGVMSMKRHPDAFDDLV